MRAQAAMSADSSSGQDPQPDRLGAQPEHHDGEPCEPPTDLLYGSSDRSGTGRVDAPSGPRGVGGWFADPTPGADDHGRVVPCRSCGTPLSQPRIDVGLPTCTNCCPSAPSTPTAVHGAASQLDAAS